MCAGGSLRRVLTLRRDMGHSPPASTARLLQLQLHVVELLLGRGADGNIHVGRAFTVRLFRRRILRGERERPPCRRKRSKVLISMKPDVLWAQSLKKRQVIYPANKFCPCSGTSNPQSIKNITDPWTWLFLHYNKQGGGRGRPVFILQLNPFNATVWVFGVPSQMNWL